MNRGIKKTIIIFTIIALLVILLFKVIRVQDIIMKKIYPTKYAEYVYKYSEKYDVDPFIIFAIIKAESNFNPNVISSSEAIGLMQLMDSTAQELADDLRIDYVKKASLYNPELNIEFGTKYFSDLMKEYDNNYLLALTAYNAGIGNVKKWVEQGIIKADGSDIENIPFKETNNYVRKIVRDYEIYKKLWS